MQQALDRLDIKNVLKAIYMDADKYYKSQNPDEGNQLQKEIDYFFGPSKIFIPVFKNAIAKIMKYEKEINEKCKEDKDSSEEQVKDSIKNHQRFRIENEPIFESILHTMVLGLALNLKKKARIKIRDSCVLIGVIDE